MSERGIGGHQSQRADTVTWLTPPEILAQLGHFDLDPRCPQNMPRKTADRMIALPDDGLSVQWFGRVWLNPPYNAEARAWLNRLADHGHGIALTFARTETAWFFEAAWRRATAILFLEGRLHFHHADGRRAANNAGAPSVLIAYGESNADVLRTCAIPGAFVRPLRRAE